MKSFILFASIFSLFFLAACDSAQEADLEPGTFEATVSSASSVAEISGTAVSSSSASAFEGAFQMEVFRSPDGTPFQSTILTLTAESGAAVLLGHMTPATIASGSYDVTIAGRDLQAPYEFFAVYYSGTDRSQAVASSGSVSIEEVKEETPADRLPTDKMVVGIAGTFTLNLPDGTIVDGTFNAVPDGSSEDGGDERPTCAEIKAAHDRAVAAGNITQEAADQRYAAAGCN